jgi:hypothetical protein
MVAPLYTKLTVCGEVSELTVFIDTVAVPNKPLIFAFRVSETVSAAGGDHE